MLDKTWQVSYASGRSQRWRNSCTKSADKHELGRCHSVGCAHSGGPGPDRRIPRFLLCYRIFCLWHAKSLSKALEAAPKVALKISPKHLKDKRKRNCVNHSCAKDNGLTVREGSRHHSSERRTETTKKPQAFSRCGSPGSKFMAMKSTPGKES